MVFDPILKDLFYRRILLETLATGIGWFFGFILSVPVFVDNHNEFVYLVMGKKREFIGIPVVLFIAIYISQYRNFPNSLFRFHLFSNHISLLSFSNYVHIASEVSYSFFINWN